MKVTPVKKKFGKYAPGDEFEFPDKAAKLFIRLGKLVAVGAAPTYQTRMMQAEAPAVVQQAVAPSFEPAAAPAVTEDASQQEAAIPQEEVDSSGAAWDERVHSSTRAQNTDGTWRKRPGPRSAEE